ncbi:MAG: DUF2442 domain-containing protein [Pyrinomonadaceae bacterium MAG19_C2-C3]|nr:DUF2442 domain-containing protein [Pyrinomonadaceae bacterium MAG19_C2-C3]
MAVKTQGFTLHKIIEVAPISGYKLSVTFADGSETIHECAPIIEKEGGAFRALADEQLFRTVEVGARGRFIQWAGVNVDLCADALWLEAHEAKG